MVAAVTYRGQTFVAVGGDGPTPMAWTSTDGQTWTQRSVPRPVSPAYQSVRLGPIAELAGSVYSLGTGTGGGDSLTPIVWTSSDGSDWQLLPQAAAGAIPAGRQVWGLTATTDRLVAITNGFAAYSGEVWSSTDGQNWKESVLPTAAAGNASMLQLNDIAFDGTRLAIAGETYGHSGQVWLSSDGQTWSVQSVQPGTAAVRALALAPGGTGLVAVGTANGRPMAWTSPAGAGWVAAAPAPAGTGQEEMHSLVRVGDRYVALGSSATGTIVWSSVDGATWSRQGTELPGLIDGYVGLIGSDLLATDGHRLITFLMEGLKPTAWIGVVR